ncbi:MAG: adenosylcobinamide-GDP ribazoletransferase [Dehalococcoidia bacterium]|nr:adenosylcobinamide-GDP ribazoletransferase [Dehalococcoidia bacterium]
MGFWAALQFLTILPSPVKRDFTAEEVGQSLACFPLVGLLLGLILWGADYVLSRVLPPLPVDVLLLGMLVVLTGAIHIDGFIDTCDGAVARRTVQQRLDIMADSRVGAFGVIGGCLLLLLKFAALVSLPGAYRGAGLVLMPLVGRWSIVYSVFAYPYARREGGTGHAFKQGASITRALIALAMALAVATVVSRNWHGAALVGAVWIGVIGFCAYVRSRLGGLTGDSYGAVNEVAEVATLVILPIIWRA